MARGRGSSLAPLALEVGHVPDEWERARLISDISRVLTDPAMPGETRKACLTLVGRFRAPPAG